MVNLPNGIERNVRVLVVWPGKRKEPALEKIVNQCLSSHDNVTIIGDYTVDEALPEDVFGLKVQSVHDLLAPHEETAVVKAAYDLARGWFDTPAMGKVLTWQGIRLGEMLERLLPTSFLTDAIRLVEGVLKWVELERPALVVLPDDRSQISIAFRQVAMQKAIPTLTAPRTALQVGLADLKETARHQFLWGLLDLRDLIFRRVWARLVHLYGRRGSRKCDNNAPVAVFVGFDRNHYKHILPIAKQLKNEGWQILVLRGLTGKTWRADEGLNHSVVKIETIDGYGTTYVWSRYGAAKRRIREGWRRLAQDSSWSERFVYRSVNLWPLVKEDLQYCFYVYLPTAVRYLELTRQIINAESPQVFVFGNDSCPRGHSMIAAARKRGIPTWVVQHGITANPWVYVPYSDKMIVWGELSRQALLGCGADPERLMCAGAPGLDPLIWLAMDDTHMARRRAAVCRQLGMKDTTNLVILLSSPDPGSDQVLFFRLAFQAAKDLELEDRLVVKLHPNETGRLPEKIAFDMGIHPLMTKEIDLWGLIAASQVVITSLNSTAGLEALLLRKPVIAVRTHQYHSIYSGVNGLVRQVETESELKQQLTQLLNGHSIPGSAGLEQFVGPLDGRAAARAADLIAGRVTSNP
jgi:hypothetical protein